jgi:hypothetical protein
MVVCDVVVDITAGTSASLLQWPEVGQWQRSLLGGACLAPNLMPIFTTSSVQGSKMGGQLSPAGAVGRSNYSAHRGSWALSRK